jgi:6-phosphogluconolactonase
MPINLYKPKVFEFETLNVLYQKTTEYILDKISAVQGENGIARLMLTGGETPIKLYSKLATSGLDWSNVEIYQSDERYLPSTTVNSNQYNIIKALGDDVINECREVNFFNTDLPVQECLQDYNERLDALDGVLFDQTILGIGTDGHIASLFPRQDYLKAINNTHCIETIAPEEFTCPERVSLTINTILNSKDIVVLLTGEKKINVLTEMLEGNLSAVEFPAKVLLSHPNLTIFFSASH